MRVFNALTRIFKNSEQNNANPGSDLSFDGLNPLLAKQLSELENQIGRLAQVQFELGQERQRMRSEMEALKKAVTDSQSPNATPNPDNESRQ